MPSPAGWREVPCVECGAFVEGIDFVQRCATCRKRRVARAGRWARHSALLGTAIMAGWVWRSSPDTVLTRWTAVGAIPLTYVLIRTIVFRVAMEALP